MPELNDVRRQLADVDAELATLGRTDRASEHAETIAQLRERFEHRFESLARAHAAAASLRPISSQPELLRQAPRALIGGTAFRRAVLSVIQERALIPFAANFNTGGTDPDDADPDDAAGDDEAAEQALAQLREQPITLGHHMPESDAIRRRRATLVSNVEINARVDRRMAGVLGWSAFVIAPLISGAGVTGLIHADRGPGQPLDVLDRDVLWEFASVFSQINESAELRRTLRHEQDEMRRFVDRVTELSLSLADAPITFGAYANARPETPGRTPLVVAQPGDVLRDDRLVFAGLLTRRELDVLRLLAEGGTNRTIADALVLSDMTVKFHVNNILRKLRVANRAEAVARYLSLLGLPSPPIERL